MGENVKHFSITFGSQNDQLNHLPPTDKKTLIIWLRQSFVGTILKKQSHISYRFLDLTIRKLQTHTFIEIISIDNSDVW